MTKTMWKRGGQVKKERTDLEWAFGYQFLTTRYRHKKNQWAKHRKLKYEEK